jgi:hypothetical protein
LWSDWYVRHLRKVKLSSIDRDRHRGDIDRSNLGRLLCWRGASAVSSCLCWIRESFGGLVFICDCASSIAWTTTSVESSATKKIVPAVPRT